MSRSRSRLRLRPLGPAQWSDIFLLLLTYTDMDYVGPGLPAHPHRYSHHVRIPTSSTLVLDRGIRPHVSGPGPEFVLDKRHPFDHVAGSGIWHRGLSSLHTVHPLPI
jgi:hypothetical protein